ncbi:MAG: hypothetical protein AB7U62_10020 [Pseudolabrys sp.]
MKVFVPEDSGHREEILNVKYRVIESDRAASILGKSQGGALFDLIADDKQNSEFLNVAVVSLDGLTDERDNRIECSDIIRAELLKLPFVRSAIGASYREAVGKVATGN